ncbi:MAG TPA: gamma-glutamyltransferase, partial [Longimicrobiales bacterium]|nr:gamma-glutamyltransferase [Longimicrobiales bacterium]
MKPFYLLVAALQGAPAGGQWHAVAPDGRIAFEFAGDLYLTARNGSPIRITTGSGIDRQPAWTPDGRWLVFVSDRAGNSDLWRIEVRADNTVGQPERLTTSPEPDFDPAVAADGRIVFARGANGSIDLFVRSEDGSERKLVSAAGPDRSPSVARDGTVAYIAFRDNRRQLRTVNLDGKADRVVLSEPAAEYPAWSPRGDRIAFTSASGGGGVLITNRDGAYANVLSRRRGRPAWLPTGDSLLIAELPDDAVGYNGDPDRVGDRDAERDFLFDGRLWRVVVPAPPDAGSSIVALTAAFTDSTKLEAFDRVVSRIAEVYLARPERADARASWQRTAAALRPQAARAGTRAELDQVIHELLQQRPPLRLEASGRAGVSSAHPLATEAGLEMLRRGGNVVDAAVAVSFALGVVEPDASGVGGYGQMLIHLPELDRPALIEFMARAPEEASLNNAALSATNLPGPALAIVPGTVDGMWRAWQRYGSKKLKWAELLEPAIRLAEQGFVLDDAFPTTLRREQQEYAKHESARALFFRNGRPLSAGDTLR